MARGVIGAEIYQERIEKRVTEARRLKRGRPKQLSVSICFDN